MLQLILCCALFTLSPSALAHDGAQSGTKLTDIRAPFTLVLADGTALTLPDLAIPSDAAHLTAIKERLTGLPLTAHPAGTDRWQRHIATLTTADGQDISTLLVNDGLAQLLYFPQAPSAALISAERSAQQARRGLWADPCCQLLDASQPVAALKQWPLGQWRAVRGTVHAVSARRELTYVNFGPDWRTDFTILIPKRVASTLDLSQLTGKVVEVRGVLEWYYGPALRVDAASQILLPETGK